jgi:hypothetical protein
VLHVVFPIRAARMRGVAKLAIRAVAALNDGGLLISQREQWLTSTSEELFCPAFCPARGASEELFTQTTQRKTHYPA